MKIKSTTQIAVAVLLLAVLNYPRTTVFAQGSLAPPGAPAPTMKSLDQIETRTPVDATHTPGNGANEFIVSQPGAYYLTGNLTGVTNKAGILIATNDVTLDLNGFSLTGVPLKSGIVTLVVQNITVRNGVVKNWGSIGIDCSQAVNSTVEKIRTYGNGNYGIELGAGGLLTGCVANGNDRGMYAIASTISDCTAFGNTGFGISADNNSTVSKCTSNGNSLTGISAGSAVTVSGCTASGNSDGIDTGTGATVTGCTASGNTSHGITTGDQSMIVNCSVSTNGSGGISCSSKSTVNCCTASGNTGDGISANRDCFITGNNASGNSGNGITVSGQINRVDGNFASENGKAGISWVNDFVVRNSCFLNATNYSPATGGNVGPVQAASTSSNPFANF